MKAIIIIIIIIKLDLKVFFFLKKKFVCLFIIIFNLVWIKMKLKNIIFF